MRNNVRSVGDGVEREIIYALWARYLVNSYTEFFAPKADDYATVRVCFPEDCIPQSRLDAMVKFGIVAGLLIVYGMAPFPLDPCILQYYAFNFDRQAIHREFFSHYHPETAALIDEWIRIGPSGPVHRFQSHFINYHDHEVSIFFIAASCLLANYCRRRFSPEGTRPHTIASAMRCWPKSCLDKPVPPTPSFNISSEDLSWPLVTASSCLR